MQPPLRKETRRYLHGRYKVLVVLCNKVCIRYWIILRMSERLESTTSCKYLAAWVTLG